MGNSKKARVTSRLAWVGAVVLRYKYFLLVSSISPTTKPFIFNFKHQTVLSIYLLRPFDNMHTGSMLWFNSPPLENFLKMSPFIVVIVVTVVVLIFLAVVVLIVIAMFLAAAVVIMYCRLVSWTSLSSSWKFHLNTISHCYENVDMFFWFPVC